MDLMGYVTPERGALRQQRGWVITMSVLAIVEAGAFLFFATSWFRTGADMIGHGVLVLPLLGVVLYFRAALLVTTATLYLLFAWAALTGRRWAWPMGLAAVALDGLLVLTLLADAGVRVAARGPPAHPSLRSPLGSRTPRARAMRPKARPGARLASSSRTGRS